MTEVAGEAADSVAEEDREDTKPGSSSISAQYVVRFTLRANFHKAVNDSCVTKNQI
jgi:hypothetical protein